ncbi:MAG: hypothetical protein PVG06_09745 [Desulfobacterales bacterium]|jgi:hypothetical protein
MRRYQIFKRLPRGRLHFLGVLIFTISLLSVNPAWSEYRDFEDHMISILKYSAGFASAFLIHEGGHLLAAEATGTDMNWERGNYNQPLAFTEEANSDTDGLIVNSAGLVTQAIGAEIILQVDRIDKNDDFVRGMMYWNILNPIFYALDYWFIHHTNSKSGNSYQGDIQGIENYSDETTANVFAASMVAIAGIQGYRFLKTQDWAPDWLRDEAQNLNFAPTPTGGFSFSYTINF